MNHMEKLRKKRKLTMKEVAKQLGMPYTTYVNYEKGAREPNSEALIKISRFYNCSIDYLLDRGDQLDLSDQLPVFADSEDPHPLLVEIANGDLALAKLLQYGIKTGELNPAYKAWHEIKEAAQSRAADTFDGDAKLEKLIRCYKALNGIGQERLCQYAEELAGHPAYKKK